ncbi:MAG: YitT family protein [Clostridia bacterium]|nr:YitT family protein [Clostridia bacterium]
MKNNIKPILTTILGTIFTAIGISLFLSPNTVVSGGVSGISIILYNTLGVPMGVSYAVINIVLLVLGLKVLGKRFILWTLLGIGSLSIFLEIFALIPPATENLIVAAVFGGVLYGLGIGITLASGASTGGGDIIGRLIQTKFKALPIGKILMIVDGIIIGSSMFIFDSLDLVFFGAISMYLSTYAIDKVIGTLNVSKIAFVITDKGEEISNKIITTSPRGVTMIDAVGGYTSDNKKVLFCAMKNKEVPEFQRKVLEIDENAFVVFAKSQQILGNGFYIYH